MTQQIPTIPEHVRIQRLIPPQDKIRLVLDTDTFNEVDDQFALVYALQSTEKITVEAVYAAPFQNERAKNAEEGMQQSYDEILRLLAYMDVSVENFVFKGSRQFLTSNMKAVASPATDDLIARALASSPDDPLYVVAIGALTNVVSAILQEPHIIEHIVVVWLGGNALQWQHALEFNLTQDLIASQILFNCGVPLVQIPCAGVTSHLHTNVAELERYVSGHSRVGDYLVDIVKNYRNNKMGWSKVIWDIAPIAYLLNQSWMPNVLTHTPILNDNVTWSRDESRHLMRYAYYANRDPIFYDLFTKLSSTAS